jgi:hypothetical protein
MQNKFRALVLASAALAAAAFTSNTAKAEGTALHVPFSFTVAGKSLPAGEYTVEKDHRGNFLKLQSEDSGQNVILVAAPTAVEGGIVSLKFDTQGDTHILHSVQYGHVITARLDKQKKQREEISPRDVSGQ